MKIGRRTQAYFVGFFIGIALVSILIDSRRQRMLERQTHEHRWESLATASTDLPHSVLGSVDPSGQITGVRQLDGKGIPTGFKAFFFRDFAGKRYWLAYNQGDYLLYSGEALRVTAQQGFEYELMCAGFEHQGHEVISPPEMAPIYMVRIQPHSAMDFVDKVENLLSKRIYIALVEWIEWSELDAIPSVQSPDPNH